MIDTLVILFTTSLVVIVVLRAIALDAVEPWFMALRPPQRDSSVTADRNRLAGFDDEGVPIGRASNRWAGPAGPDELL